MPLHTKPAREIDHVLTGQAYRRKRKGRGISLRDMAKKLSISAGFLSDLERGRRNWDEARAASMDKALEEKP